MLVAIKFILVATYVDGKRIGLGVLPEDQAYDPCLGTGPTKLIPCETLGVQIEVPLAPKRGRRDAVASQAPPIGGPLATPVRPKLHAFVQYESINVAEKTAKPSQARGRRDMMEKNPGKKKMLLYLSNDQSNNLRSLLSNLMLTSKGIW
ncbi:uncharacterized protein LOC120293782 [Eucalyptus grandis]|uniref:uncharacterized protein LOC120293782 n=1 Tax=Eucalyptus grandis TaxID=71139 RepID=UPI00192ED313|nr:uncharacterized protein LOC120293782 [Eucalyptus grandis]